MSKGFTIPGLTTLERYIGWHFFRTFAYVFMAVIGLIFIIDFVELLRRSNDTAGNIVTLALMSLFRTPAIAEKVFPFIALAASMICLVSLTRRLELVVARTAGVSVWQFLRPVVVLAFLAGLVSIIVYNPLATALTLRADKLETGLGNKGLQASVEDGLWLRQRSVDGQSVLRAEKSSNNGLVLAQVTAYVYDSDGRFLEQVQAAQARLADGAWELTDARVNAPGRTPRTEKTYLLATNLSRTQVSQSFRDPDVVPFWELRAHARRTEVAGLNAAPYLLKFQQLLAQPLLFIAMVFISACFSLRFFRFGGVATAVSGGIASGFVLYVATKLAADLGEAGLVNAPFAAWSPAVVGTMLGVLVLLHQEDG